MATYSKSSVYSITAYNNNAVTVTSGSHSLFQASSTTNVLTMLSGEIFVNILSGTFHFALFSTNGADPGSNNGVFSLRADSGVANSQYFARRISGTTYLTAANSQTNNISVYLDSSSYLRMVKFENYIIQPGHFAYLYASGGSTLAAYSLVRTELSQS